MAVCQFCEREMQEHVSCLEAPVEYPDGQSLPQIRYGDESNEWTTDPCHDCGAPKGAFHHVGCDVEECGRCHGQLISCGCLDDGEEEQGRPYVPAETLRQLLGPRPPRRGMDGVLAGIRQNIDTVGWSAIAIGGGPCACCGEQEHSGPDFLYTVGLTETFAAPELVVFGLPPSAAHGTVASVVNRLRAGESFAAGEIHDGLANLPLAFIEVPKDEFSGRLNCASLLYGDDFRALQLVWPDPKGRFPWDEGFEERFRDDQPLLGAWMGSS